MNDDAASPFFSFFTFFCISLLSPLTVGAAAKITAAEVWWLFYILKLQPKLKFQLRETLSLCICRSYYSTNKGSAYNAKAIRSFIYLAPPPSRSV